MRIGVTGIDGLLGQSTKTELSNIGHDVVSLDNFTRDNAFISRDEGIKNLSPLKWVIHYASKTSIDSSWKNPFEIYHSNFASTLIALKIAKQSNSAFIYMSSYVYGLPNYQPVDENHPTEAINPYMSSKLIGEELATKICGINKIPLVILRGSNIYGKKIFPGRLISDLMLSHKENKPFKINNPDPVRDYLYIKDFTSLILKIIESPTPEQSIFNVGSGECFSNLEVAQVFHEVSNKKSEILRGKKSRPSDILDASINVDLIKKTYKWSVKYPLRKGLEDLLLADAGSHESEK
tara:strand:- start:638 stop:1516 length:879 start_codon:yes stop_codon:yes gene_type:complete